MSAKTEHTTRLRQKPAAKMPAAEPEQDLDRPGPIGPVLRKARARRGWSLREVERRTGIANAYLSQVERGAIRKPDGAVLWQLSDLYRLDFALLAKWCGHTSAEATASTMSVALRALAAMDPEGQKEALSMLLERANSV